MSKKKSTEAALLKYYENQIPKYQTFRKKKNNKPEKITEQECLEYMRGLGWQVAIYESKAIYNPKAGRFISQNMKAGTCDCMGTMPCGTSVAVEFKAKGRVADFNKPHARRQREFIENKITMNAFATVTDSVARLKETFENWHRIRFQEGPEAARNYLFSILPKYRNQKNKDDDQLFDDIPF